EDEKEQRRISPHYQFAPVSRGLILPTSARLLSTSSASSSSSPNFTNQLPTYDDVKYSQLDSRRKRLLFRSKERGMLETDLILGSFAIQNLEAMNETQLAQFEQILDCIDPDLFLYLTKKVETPAELDNEVMHAIQKHTFNNPLNYDSTANRKLN
ncbi:TPR repeat region protein, partial [Acanthamoeba castellanii str. Neff]